MEFSSWNRLKVDYDEVAVRRFLKTVAEESKKAFKKGMDGPHTGRIRKFRGRSHQASAPLTEYPANFSGRTKRSITTKVGITGVSIGARSPYSGYLRSGTKRMERRKMSDNALRSGLQIARRKLGSWVEWKKM